MLAEVVVGVQAWRVDVRGLEKIPRDGGALLAFYHHSYFDFVMVAWDVVRKVGRPITFMAKKEMWSSPARLLVRWAQAVPVDRDRKDSRLGAYSAVLDALHEGNLVGVAPEQTISRSFEMLPFRTGAVRMAQTTGAPIIPVIGWGTQRFAGKGLGLHFRWRLPVIVVYGDPMYVAADEDAVEATVRLQRRMEAMLAQVQESYPDDGTGQPWQPARLGGSAPSHADVLAAHLDRQRKWNERPDAEAS